MRCTSSGVRTVLQLATHVVVVKLCDRRRSPCFARTIISCGTMLNSETPCDLPCDARPPNCLGTRFRAFLIHHAAEAPLSDNLSTNEQEERQAQADDVELFDPWDDAFREEVKRNTKDFEF